MSATNVIAHTESYVYDGIEYRRITEQKVETKRQRAGLLSCLSQGVTTGSILIFLVTALSIVDRPDYYSFGVIQYFPLYLVYGVGTGLVQGLVLWACGRLVGHNLRWYMRMIVAGLVVAIPYTVMLLIVFSLEVIKNQYSLFLLVALVMAAIGATFGLLTGSRFSPWRQLVRGDDSLPVGSWLFTGATGLLLRVAIVFFLMVAFLAAIIVSNSRIWEAEFIWPILFLLHFQFAFAVAFLKLRFWMLLTLAVVLNIPVIILLNYLAKEAPAFAVYICTGYLGAWVLFLISRCPPTYVVFDFLKQEFKYYLID